MLTPLHVLPSYYNSKHSMSDSRDSLGVRGIHRHAFSPDPELSLISGTPSSEQPLCHGNGNVIDLLGTIQTRTQGMSYIASKMSLDEEVYYVA